MKKTDPFPFYVTRPTRDGVTYKLSVSAWFLLYGPMLIWLNIIVWSLLGLILAARLVIGWF